MYEWCEEEEEEKKGGKRKRVLYVMEYMKEENWFVGCNHVCFLLSGGDHWTLLL